MMNQFEIKENITSLLQAILDRSLQINNEPKDPLLEIDLLMDDLRQLYRQYESLRSVYSSQPGHHEDVRPAAEEPESTPDEAPETHLPEPEVTAANVAPAANLPQQEAGEPLAMEREPTAPEPDNQPEETRQEPPAAQQPQQPAREPQPDVSREEGPVAAGTSTSGEQPPAEPQEPVSPIKEEDVTPPQEP
ncbi:MAG: hypothetical protein R6U64_00310, partial [Bacteroidales bacterium]